MIQEKLKSKGHWKVRPYVLGVMTTLAMLSKASADVWYHYEDAVINAPTGTSSSQFGKAVDTDRSDRVLIGSPSSEYVYIYEETSPSVWERTFLVDSTTAFAGYPDNYQDIFGRAVAIDGDNFVATSGDSGGNNNGALVLYGKDSEGTWSRIAIVYTGGFSSSQTNSYFGRAVALRGNSLMVGVSGGDSTKTAPESDYGFVQFYQFNATANDWFFEDLIQPEAANYRFNFGYSLGLSAGGKRLIASGPYDATSGSEENGTAHIFDIHSDGTWEQVAQLFPPDSSAASYGGFGTNCAISPNGKVAVVNRPGIIPQKAYIYEEQLDGSWLLTQTIVANDVFDYAAKSLGAGLAMTDDRILISRKQNAEVLVYDRIDGVWTHTHSLLASEANGSNFTGYSLLGLAISPDGTRAFVFNDQVGGIYSDSVFIYNLPPVGFSSQTNTEEPTISVVTHSLQEDPITSMDLTSIFEETTSSESFLETQEESSDSTDDVNTENSGGSLYSLNPIYRLFH